MNSDIDGSKINVFWIGWSGKLPQRIREKRYAEIINISGESLPLNRKRLLSVSGLKILSSAGGLAVIHGLT